MTVAGYSADFEKALNDLIPRLAAQNVPDRYAAQMELQDIASNSSKPGNEVQRAALGQALAARAVDAAVPQPARVWIVRQLEYMGGAEAVEALAKLLNGEDAELRECARRALEKNSAPAASASLRAALGNATDVTWKIGLIYALGQRGDEAAVDLIGRELNSSQTGSAAAWALGRIASSKAIEVLLGSVGSNLDAGDALLEAANRLEPARAGQQRAICEKLYAQTANVPLRGAALVTFARANPSATAPLISEALSGQEPRLQFAAISAAVLAFGKDATAKLLPLYASLRPSAKAMVLGVVDATAERQAIEAVGDADEGVRRAALDALGRMGGAASVPVLLKALTDEGKSGKSNAEASLTRIAGEGAAGALEQAAASGDAKSRGAAINALAARRQTSALPAILRYASQDEAGVQKASFAALRVMGGDAEIEPLAALAINGKSSDAAAALETVAGRVQDKPAAVRKLLAKAAGDESAQLAVLDALSALGGAEALAVVTRLTQSQSAEAQDQGLRALGSWPDFAAAERLLTIASSPDAKPNHHRLALQGLVRLVKSAENEPAEVRLESALAALKVARNDEEKKWAISALGSVPHPKAAATLTPLLSEPAFKEEAALASVALAELLVKTDKTTARNLATAVKAANPARDISRRADRVLSR